MQTPTPRATLQDTLTAAEKQMQSLGDALLEGLPDRVASASSDLQQAVLALAGMVQSAQRSGALDSRFHLRLQRLGQSLAMQREACLRRSAVVDRSLASIIPSSRTTTYGGGATPYGQQARRTGAFKLVAA